MANATTTLVLLAFVGIGLLLLWTVRAVDTISGVRWSTRSLLQIGGCTLVVIGLLALQVHLLVYVSLVGWMITVGVTVMALLRYGGGERRALMWCLVAASQRGIPLDQVARAFARDRSDSLGTHAENLAELLAQGVPLSGALAQSWMRIPFDVLLALRLGAETGDLVSAMNKLAKGNSEADSLLLSLLEKCCYLVVVTLVLMIVLMFVMLKIVPVFEKMFREFELQLPAMTERLILVSQYIVEYWFVAAPVFLLALFILSIGVLHFFYLLPRDLPIVNRLSLRWDAALVMRSLSLAAQQRRPFENMIHILSNQYPRGSVRRRLQHALSQLQLARPWAVALQEAGILRAAEVGVLEAAQRSGNLEWALEEMADSSIRRMTYRLRMALHIGLPIILLIYGGMIAFMVVGLFIPLVSLIQGLT